MNPPIVFEDEFIDAAYTIALGMNVRDSISLPHLIMARMWALADRGTRKSLQGYWQKQRAYSAQVATPWGYADFT